MRNIVYVHIPKTGGTSVRMAMSTALGSAGYRQIFDYHRDPMTTPWLRAAPDDATRGDLIRSRVPTAAKLFLAGHFKASKYLEAFHPASFMFFVRDPFDQVYSHFNHHRVHGRYAGSFEDFFTAPAFRNMQTRMTEGLHIRHAGFVGVVENMAAEIPQLSEFLGVKLDVQTHNTGRYGETRDEMREKFGDRVLQLNAADRALYARVAQMKLGAAPAPPAEPARNPRWHCAWSGENMIHGWVVLAGGRRVAHLRALDETGQVVAETAADLYRKDLKVSAILPHGVGGFALRVPAAAPASTIQP